MSDNSTPQPGPTYENKGNVGVQGQNYGTAIGQSNASQAVPIQSAAQLAAELRGLRALMNQSIDEGQIDSATYKRAQKLIGEAEEHIDEANDDVNRGAVVKVLIKCKECVKGAIDVVAKIATIINATKGM